MKRISILLIPVLALLLGACEKIVTVDELDIDYEPQIKIQGDFFPQNLGKSVLRIDRTFTIADTMDRERAHIRDAEAALLRGTDTISAFTWYDSASSYIYLNLEEFDPSIVFGDSVEAYQDTQSYGGYKLDFVDFVMYANQEYILSVTIDNATYTTTFIPEPAIEIINVEPDSLSSCDCGAGTGIGTFQIVHETMSIDTARIMWPENPNARFYTITMRKLDAEPPERPQVFSFPGPVLTLQAMEPGEYELIIGTMNETWYRHYLLRDFPPNHETRNFFGGDVLGFAGTLNERYLRITLVPPGS